jgi:hypothetical protein
MAPHWKHQPRDILSMNIFALGAGAVGAAALVALSIVAPFSLIAAPAEKAAPVSATPPAHAREGSPAWPVGIPTPGEPKVFFANLKDGAVVTSPVTIEFGALGMRVSPAGEGEDGTGHHHLLINTTLAGAALKEAIPADAQHLHFGKGERRVTLDLPKGKHTLQLVAGDANHVPHATPVMSKPITITVR